MRSDKYVWRNPPPSEADFALESRFRSLQSVAAHPDANFGIRTRERVPLKWNQLERQSRSSPSSAATRCIQVRGAERVWSNRTLRRLSPSSSNMESKRSFWVASVVQLRAIAKRTVARRTEMLVDIPSATQAAEYVRHCCPLIMEALPRTTARPRARTGVRLQSSHVEAISTLAVRLFRQQFAPQLDAMEWAPRLPCSSGGLMSGSAWRRRRPINAPCHQPLA
jgi:hypothetical protein